MVTFRLHLDDADENNGCLKVIPGSHNMGILSQTELTNVVNSQEPFLCKVKEGDLVLMRPHILHSSSKSSNPGHRRVVHVEYSNFKLPGNLKWA
jgi:ectoine hydroxylase-related dioxygenase (phytanoyl-CoA dioxygenase family)